MKPRIIQVMKNFIVKLPGSQELHASHEADV